MINRDEIINNARTIVIKMGSSLLSANQGVDHQFISSFVEKIAQLKESGKTIVIVTSGAVACGMELLGIKTKSQKIPKRQAMAAIGQPLLMHAYAKEFSKYKIHIGQMLLTKDGLENRTRFLNAKHAMLELINEGVVPIINENDTISVDELKLGDNDQLSAQVAHLVEADLLLILTDVDGLYDDDPRENPNAKRISKVEDISKIDSDKLGKNSLKGTGGMITKVLAATQAVSFGIPTWIIKGSDINNLDLVFSGKDIGTIFTSQEKSLSGKKFWIAHTAKSKGKIRIDEGAVQAVTQSSKSLLVSGISEVIGVFEIGDIVDLIDSHDKTIAKGLVNYSSEEIDQIKGLGSNEIESVLGYKYYDEIIHRNEMVLNK